MNKIFKYEVKSGDFENGGKISDDIREKLRALKLLDAFPLLFIRVK